MVENCLAACSAQPHEDIADKASYRLVPELRVRLLVANALARCKPLGGRGRWHVPVFGRDGRAAHADFGCDNRARRGLVLRNRVVDVVSAVSVLRDLARDSLAVRHRRLLAAERRIAANAHVDFFAYVLERGAARQVFFDVLLDALALLDRIAEKPRVGIALQIYDVIRDAGR